MSDTGWLGSTSRTARLDQAAERRRVAGRARHEGERADGQLRERQIDGGPLLAVQAGERDVADHAHDLLRFAERVGQAAAEGRDVGRELPHERLVHDGDARTVRDVGVGEVAAGPQRNLQRGEVAGVTGR